MIKVGITGGIGSGKSTVCRLFAACGAPVYDSDTQAKRLMEEDGPLRRRLAARFGEEIYAGGRLNRKLLAGHLRRIGSRNSGSPSARKMIKVGITGGIGSGKSTVCRLFAACGAPVYDSDTQAKRLMEEDGPLRRRLAARFGEEIYAGGRLNRKLLAGRVFSDPAELSALNALVHPAVMEDFERWCGRQSGADYVVLESAILFEAGLEGYVDRTIAVTAPIDVRIARTCLRDGASAEEVRRRIAVQLDEEELRRRADYTLVNINLGELEYEVARLDKLLRDENRKHSA
jgi:dephospho-CoA kinase